MECAAFGVPENQDSARRWSGFVCPDCRFVFRVARDHDGSGLVCPSCRRLLRIPTENDLVPPLLVEQLLKDEGQSVQDADGSFNVRRKRKRKRRSGESPGWEDKGRRFRRGDTRHGFLSLGVGFAVLIAILGIVVFTTRDEGDDAQAGDLKPVEGIKIPSEIPAPPSEDAGLDSAADPDPAPTQQRDNARFLSDAHSVARAFLQATSVEELLKVVDHPEVVAERIKRDHPDGVIEPLGLGDFSQFSQVRYVGAYGIVPLRTGDFQIRIMTFRIYPDELKVDWESWVGWSETAWGEFMEKRPPGAHIFRVKLGAVEYYNFDFTDEQKWQSYRLIGPDDSHSLYGYVERNSLLSSQLRAHLEQGLSHAMVEVRFAENPTTNEQVEITRMVSDDWIDPERASEP